MRYVCRCSRKKATWTVVFSVIACIVFITYSQRSYHVSTKVQRPITTHSTAKTVGVYGGREDRPSKSIPMNTSHITDHSATSISLPVKRQTIPRIIHQIWNDEFVPSVFVDNIKGLAKDNPFPEWTYLFWTKASTTAFIRDKYPGLLDRVSSKNTSHILRSDILRYVVIHEYGGMYFDLDTVSLKPLQPYVDTHSCSLAKEPGEHLFVHRTDFLLTNGALFCVPKHPFYKLILSTLKRLNAGCTRAFTCTGPPFLSRLFRQFNKSQEDSAFIPDIESSEIFQDKYDIEAQNRRVHAHCSNYDRLKQYQRDVCDEWKARGMEGRNISEKALTYHTWYHVSGKGRLELSQRNHVFKLIPHAKIYGMNWNGRLD